VPQGSESTEDFLWQQQSQHSGAQHNVCHMCNVNDTPYVGNGAQQRAQLNTHDIRTYVIFIFIFIFICSSACVLSTTCMELMVEVPTIHD
jgi:hypothetical protein